jgi:outer membrane murein-binding lipoprotein Lpp
MRILDLNIEYTFNEFKTVIVMNKTSLVHTLSARVSTLKITAIIVLTILFSGCGLTPEKIDAEVERTNAKIDKAQERANKKIDEAQAIGESIKDGAEAIKENLEESVDDIRDNAKDSLNAVRG